MKNKKTWLSKTAMTLGILIMLGASGTGLGSIAHATPDVPYISTSRLSDNSSDRTITLWKYEIKSSAELGERGDGEKLDPSTAPDLVGKKLMGDVEFEIVRVIPKKDGASNYYKLDDPTKQIEGTHYDIDSSFTPIKQKTGDHTTGAGFGKTTFNVGKGKAGDGIYLIREVPDSNGDYSYTDEKGDLKKVATPMAPFFAYLPQTRRDNENRLIYDVHVYPKNIVNDTSADKTIEGQKGYSIKAGQPFQWEATVKLPTGLYFKADKEMTITNVYDKDGNKLPDKSVSAGDEVYANYFYIHDALNKALYLDDVEVDVFDGTNWTKLTLNTDYKVFKNGSTTAEAKHPIKNPNGAVTDVRIELTEAGMKKVEGTFTDIRATYYTHTDVDFNGVIENKFETGYLIPGQKPVEIPSENNPKYFDGGFVIDKTEEDKGKKLAGAEFYIAISEQDAKDKKFLASDGKSYTLKDDGSANPALPTGVTFLKDTTDDKGHAQFDGLALNWYTDKNNNNKQDEDEPTWNLADISRDYWLVETKSPDGFELLKEPIKVTVKTNPSDVSVHVENKAQTKLPFTGGTGTTLIIIIAIGSITIGTAAIAIDKKRRAA